MDLAMNASIQDLSTLSRTELEGQLARLCSHYYATEFQLLRYVRECERRGSELSHGMKSTAHWLHARFGIALGAAREKVRVANALAELPAVADTLSRGEISYSKVRALTRIAGPDNETELLQFAERSTAADMEQLCKEYRQLEKLENPEWPAIQYRMRRLGWYWDEEGMLVIEGRLPPVEGALFIKLMEWQRDQLYREERAKRMEAENEDDKEQQVAQAEDASPVTAAERRADALLRFFETDDEQRDGAQRDGAQRDSSPRALPGVARTQVMLHVVVDAKAPAKNGRQHASHAADGPGSTRSSAAARLDPGPVISPAIARRLCCDAAKALMVENATGDPLSVGRQSRIVPWHIRKALEQRDGGCRFPGCTEKRYVDAHHIEHWVDGGETSLGNCCLLCRHHHRLIHEEGYGCEKVGGGIRFYDPQGQQLGVTAEAPPAVRYTAIPGVSAETQAVRDAAFDENLYSRPISRMTVRDRPMRLSG